ncbi:unnamed protein product, partial [Staurois parvus]
DFVICAGDCGDHVVVKNTRHIAFSGNKWEQKVYSSHTGYPGGFKQVTAAVLHRKDPTAIVKLAVYGMLPKNLYRKTLMLRLHIFPEEDIPEDILRNLVTEIKQPRVIPRRLDEYTQEEVEAYPKLWIPYVYFIIIFFSHFGLKCNTFSFSQMLDNTEIKPKIFYGLQKTLSFLIGKPRSTRLLV